MTHTATGRPNGRPRGRKSDATLERERVEREVRAAAFADLTEEQILAITPADMFRLVALAAIRAQDLPFILKAAEAWAPYQMPRLASEVHRVFTDDSKRSADDIDAELAAIRSAAKDAAESAKHDADADEAARASARAGEVEEGMPEQSHGVVH
jgi:ribosome recycling factor